MDNAFITTDQVMTLSSLPTREVLLAQLVGGLKSPIFNLHKALNWNLQKLVLTLNAVANTKPAQAQAPATEPEKLQEEAQTEEKSIEEPKGGEN
ncbi:MAG: hypothetical protein HYT06_01275 [Candidatus Levybacteria bacterium]|nr:hypothetical protein [Candidatus Levybacteria bacterium]